MSRRSPWLPRVLLGIGALAVIATVVSIAVGEGGPDAPGRPRASTRPRSSSAASSRRGPSSARGRPRPGQGLQRPALRAVRRVPGRGDRPGDRALRTQRGGAVRVQPLLARARADQPRRCRRDGGGRAGSPVAVHRSADAQPGVRPRATPTRSSSPTSRGPSPSSSSSNGRRTGWRRRPLEIVEADADEAVDLELSGRPGRDRDRARRRAPAEGAPTSEEIEAAVEEVG